MGNSLPASKNSRRRRPLAIVAMANKMTMDQKQLKMLLDVCISMSTKKKSFKMSRFSFRSAMSRVKLEPRYDVDVIDLLFTMWDETGADRINYRNFCTGISPLACANQDLFSVIEFALKTMDVTESGRINKRNLNALIEGILMTSSYFGDPILSFDEMESIVDDLFKQAPIETSSIANQECIIMLARHPLILKYVMGEGTYQYGCLAPTPAPTPSCMSILTCGGNNGDVDQQVYLYEIEEPIIEDEDEDEYRDDNESASSAVSYSSSELENSSMGSF